MKLVEYELKDWIDKKIKKKIKIKSNKLLLLSIDRKVLPPFEGRKNLILVDNEDNIIWVADLPSDICDSYVSVSYKNGILNAQSSNSFDVNLDINTGKVISKTLYY